MIRAAPPRRGSVYLPKHAPCKRTLSGRPISPRRSGRRVAAKAQIPGRAQGTRRPPRPDSGELRMISKKSSVN